MIEGHAVGRGHLRYVGQRGVGRRPRRVAIPGLNMAVGLHVQSIPEVASLRRADGEDKVPALLDKRHHRFGFFVRSKRDVVDDERGLRIQLRTHQVAA